MNLQLGPYIHFVFRASVKDFRLVRQRGIKGFTRFKSSHLLENDSIENDSEQGDCPVAGKMKLRSIYNLEQATLITISHPCTYLINWCAVMSERMSKQTSMPASVTINFILTGHSPQNRWSVNHDDLLCH